MPSVDVNVQLARGGGVVGIGVGGGSRRSGEVEAEGLAGGSTTLWLPRVS